VWHGARQSAPTSVIRVIRHRSYDKVTQAIGRMLRPSQRRPVEIYHLVTPGTIEEHIFATQQHKCLIAATVAAPEGIPVALTVSALAASMSSDPNPTSRMASHPRQLTGLPHIARDYPDSVAPRYSDLSPPQTTSRGAKRHADSDLSDLVASEAAFSDIVYKGGSRARASHDSELIVSAVSDCSTFPEWSLSSSVSSPSLHSSSARNAGESPEL